MEQVIAVLNRAANSNAVIHTMLASVFGALTARSFMQGREIEALQAEKDSLLKENKGIKRTIWDWKQTLYAEAEANPHEALVSLATLKSIYGDVVTSKALVASEILWARNQCHLTTIKRCIGGLTRKLGAQNNYM